MKRKARVKAPRWEMHAGRQEATESWVHFSVAQGRGAGRQESEGGEAQCTKAWQAQPGCSGWILQAREIPKEAGDSYAVCPGPLTGLGSRFGHSAGLETQRQQLPKAEPGPSPAQLTLVSSSLLRIQVYFRKAVARDRSQRGLGGVREGTRGQDSGFPQTKGESRLRDGDSM